MPAAPLPVNEHKRLAALRACGVLDSQPEPDFDDLTLLAARLCDAPIALVSLLDDRRQWFKSAVGLDVPQTPREQAFCGYTILHADRFVIEDAAADPRTADNPLVTGEPGIRFYAGVPLVVAGGQAVGSLCVIDTIARTISDAQLADLTALGRQASAQLELRRRLGQLTAMNERVRRADEAKTRFLANMSHEIRTPMTAILGFADLLTDELRDLNAAGDAHTHLTTIRANAHHLLGVLNDVLDMSKIEAGKLTVERIPTDPAEVVGAVVGMLAGQAEAKGVELLARCASPIPRTITTDPTRLRQILLNLVGNAIKFTDQGRVSLAVSCDPPEGVLRVAVEDTGPGMTDRQVRRLARFEAFHQADCSTTRTHGGTGLGLSISQQLAGLLGGGIEIASRPGVGSVFTLTIATGSLDGVEVVPAQRALHAPGAPRPEDHPLPPEPASGTDLAGLRVLVVEDGPDNQRLLRRYLEAAGADAQLAANGREAVQRLAGDGVDAFDLVLMDMQMPVLDGYAATRELRLAGVSVPIIALTAHALADDRRRCLDAGCDEYLAKPVDRRALLEACGRMVAQER